MKVSTLFLNRLLPVAIALGTAWAVRGQIGHEYGATWAAAIGVLTLIAVSGRKDWYDRMPVIVAVGAIAWGAGGMISYGVVVGYGHAPDFLNVSYGLLMLVVVGALYGFLGGGITALLLSSASEKKIDWASLFTQMLAGGYLFWGFFIYQLEWFMTPPRSELWAACMGASLALGWYLYRNGYRDALRTAFYSALGAGFGFGLGNFLQRMGYTSGIPFNWWNVMEYSIGFFGGLGMAYGIFTGKHWPKTVPPNRMSNILAWVFLIVLLPVINLIEGVNTQRLVNTGKGIAVADPESFALTWQVAMWVLSLLIVLALYYYYNPLRNSLTQPKIVSITLIFFIWYIVISNVVSAIWLTPKFSSQHLYWVNLLALWLLIRNPGQEDWEAVNQKRPDAWAGTVAKWWIAAVVLILLLSLLAISFSYVHPHAQLRFK